MQSERLQEVEQQLITETAAKQEAALAVQTAEDELKQVIDATHANTLAVLFMQCSDNTVLVT